MATIFDGDVSTMFNEIIFELPESKQMLKSYQLGVAATIYSLIEWADGLENHKIESLKVKEIKELLLESVNNNDEITKLLDRMLKKKERYDVKLNKLKEALKQT